MAIHLREGWKKRLALVLGVFSAWGGFSVGAYSLGCPADSAWAFGLIALVSAFAVVSVLYMLFQFVVDGF